MKEFRELALLAGISVAVGGGWGLLKGLFDSDYSSIAEGIFTGALAGALLFGAMAAVGYLMYHLSRRH